MNLHLPVNMINVCAQELQSRCLVNDRWANRYRAQKGYNCLNSNKTNLSSNKTSTRLVDLNDRAYVHKTLFPFQNGHNVIALGRIGKLHVFWKKVSVQNGLMVQNCYFFPVQKDYGLSQNKASCVTSKGPAWCHCSPYVTAVWNTCSFLKSQGNAHASKRNTEMLACI